MSKESKLTSEILKGWRGLGKPSKARGYMARPDRTNEELVELEEERLRSMPSSKELEQQYLDDLANGN